MGSGPHPMKSCVVDAEVMGDGRMDGLTMLLGAVMVVDLERMRGDDEREGAKPMASRVAMRPTRGDWIFMVKVILG